MQKRYFLSFVQGSYIEIRNKNEGDNEYERTLERPENGLGTAVQ